MKNNRKANLFVVGAMKAGTTSFMDLLASHQDIYTSPIKEPHYFINSLPKNLYEPSRFFSNDSYFEKDFPKSHHITKIKKEAQYQKLFSLAKNEKYLAEGSTAYLSANESATLIYDYNPKAKIIIIKRDPLQRAFSQYNMDLGLGRVKRSFNEILDEEIKLYTHGKLHWNSYLAMSFYKEPIQRFKSLFNEVLIIEFEELIKNKSIILEKVSNFLEISTFENVVLIQKNKTRALRFQKVFYFLKKIGLKDYFSLFFSSKFKQKVFKRLSKDKIESLILSDKTRKEVEQIFKEES